MNKLAWNNDKGLRFFLLVFGPEVMIDRDSWGGLYSKARGEILRPSEDKQLRKRLPRMFPLIKNESWGIEDDQIPS